MNVKILQVAVLMLPMSSRGDSLSAAMGTGSAPGWLSFRRIVDIPLKRAWPPLRAGGTRDTTVNGQSARAGCTGRSSMIPARAHAGLRFACPGDRCARSCT